MKKQFLQLLMTAGLFITMISCNHQDTTTETAPINNQAEKKAKYLNWEKGYNEGAKAAMDAIELYPNDGLQQTIFFKDRFGKDSTDLMNLLSK